MTTQTVGAQAPSAKRAATSLRQLIIAGLAGAAVMAGIIAIVGPPLLLAHQQDFPFEQQYGHVMIGVAARVLGGNATNPVANNPRAIAAGRDAYTGSCHIWNLVAYMRSLQNGQAAAVNVPSPTFAQLQAANPNGDAVARGAAVYFAQGCQSCHGPVGDAPANLALRETGETGAIRRGRPGMPAYGPDRISDTQLNDLQAYMRTFAGSRGRGSGGEREQRGREGG